MTPTPESLRQTADAMEAEKAGKPIQYRRLDSSTGKWFDITAPSWGLDQCEYRRAPEPVTRPWSKPDDVPGPVCWIKRNLHDPEAPVCLIVEIDSRGIVIGGSPDLRVKWSNLDTDFYSTDRINWKPCTVTEEAK